MAYARWTDDSDVYVYADVRGGFTCEDCPRGSQFNCATPQEMIDHLLAHRARGERVPEPALEELRQEAQPDVHVDEEVEGLFTCRDCPRGNQFALVTAAEMLEHVLEHRAHGSNVLEDTIDKLRVAAARG